MICQIDPDCEDTIFAKGIGKFLNECVPKIDTAVSQNEKIAEAYVKTCDLYMLGKNDEMRAKSEKFMAFFTKFFDQVHSALPKIEQKKKKTEAAGKVKKVAQSAMMAELMAKQAEKAAMKK